MLMSSLGTRKEKEKLTKVMNVSRSGLFGRFLDFLRIKLYSLEIKKKTCYSKKNVGQKLKDLKSWSMSPFKNVSCDELNNDDENQNKGEKILVALDDFNSIKIMTLKRSLNVFNSRGLQ